jgi:hypothetical protein
MLCYDVEVLRGPEAVEHGWENPHAMGLGTCVVWDDVLNRYRFYGPNDLEKLITYLTHGTQHPENPVKDGFQVVVTFNGVKFDNRVLLGNREGWVTPWHNVDLLEHVIAARFPGIKEEGTSIVRRAEKFHGAKAVHNGSCNLDAICKNTLGRGKIGHGAIAPKQIQEGKWPEVFVYNLEDVRLTRDLYYFGKKYGFVVDGHMKPLRVSW